MCRARILATLLAMAVSVCVVSNAEARKWRWWFFPGFYVYGHSVRAADDRRRDRPAQVVDTARARTGGGAFGAVMDRLLRGCVQQAAEFQGWPFETIAQIISPDDAQRSALEALRVSATAAAERLLAECPQGDQIAVEAVEHSIDTVLSAYAAVEPPLRAFYSALDDEQKARLLRDMTLSRSQADEGDRRIRGRRASRPARGEEAGFGGVCEHLISALRGWPVREIERAVRLTDPQRTAFYELVTSSLKTADALASTCPAETAITPPARMARMHARLTAVREAAIAVRPAFTQFYAALDQSQKVRFAGMR